MMDVPKMVAQAVRQHWPICPARVARWRRTGWDLNEGRTIWARPVRREQMGRARDGHSDHRNRLTTGVQPARVDHRDTSAPIGSVTGSHGPVLTGSRAPRPCTLTMPGEGIPAPRAEQIPDPALISRVLPQA